MLLSLSGFLFEDEYRSQSVSFAEFCSIARSAGYGGVELRRTQVDPDMSTDGRRELVHIARDAGLRITCLTARGLPDAGKERDEFFLRYLQLCRDLECSLLKIGGQTSWLRSAASKAQEYAVTLASNNHIGTPLETVDGTKAYFAEIDHPNFALLYDSLHLYVCGEDYLRCIGEFVSITRNILVHSVRPAAPDERGVMEKAGREWVAALPDEPGVQDWPAVLAGFKELRYDGPITVIENGWPKDQREHVAAHCAKVLLGLWRGRQ